MEYTAIGVLSAGVAVIAAIFWYFFGPKKRTSAQVTAAGTQEVKITVKGAYSPDVIVVKQGITGEAGFLPRRDCVVQRRSDFRRLWHCPQAAGVQDDFHRIHSRQGGRVHLHLRDEHDEREADSRASVTVALAVEYAPGQWTTKELVRELIPKQDCGQQKERRERRVNTGRSQIAANGTRQEEGRKKNTAVARKGLTTAIHCG